MAETMHPRPVTMSLGELTAVLDDIRSRVAGGDSFEGNLTWAIPEDESAPADSFDVVAMYRIGNSQGQGGMRMLGEWPGEDEAAAAGPDKPEAAEAPAEGRLARVEVKGFRDLGIVRVTESTLAGEAMLRAESADGAVAEFPASSLHFITWLPEGTQVRAREPAAIPAGFRSMRPCGCDDFSECSECRDWDERNPF